CTKAAIRFNSAAKAQRHPRMRRITEIQKTTLVVPACVIYLNCREKCILHFILIATGCSKVGKEKARLGSYIGTILLRARISGKIAEFWCRNSIRTCLRTPRGHVGREETLYWIFADSTVVCLRPVDLIVPMLTESKIPTSIRAEILIVGVCVAVRRCVERLS